MEVVSNRIKAAANSNERIHQFYFFSRYAERRSEPSICDFTFGNPHEMPLLGLAEAIRRHAIPLNKDWFAYKTSEAEPQKFVAERLTARTFAFVRARGHCTYQWGLRSDLGCIPPSA